jgi:hypothetical protein
MSCSGPVHSPFFLQDDRIPLLVSAKNGHVEVVKLLINDPRIDLSVTDVVSITVLHT